LLFWLDGDVEIGLNVQMNAKSNVKSNKTSLQNFKFPNRSEYQAVFFDMDGTLIDSEAMAAQVIMESCREWNVPLVSEDAHAIMGRTWEMAFRYLTQKYTFPLPIDQVSLMMIERYRKLLKKNVKAIAGASSDTKGTFHSRQLSIMTCAAIASESISVPSMSKKTA
jgi:beta-phosphoglucomutase-like phosphatase (HAD superfamily)